MKKSLLVLALVFVSAIAQAQELFKAKGLNRAAMAQEMRDRIDKLERDRTYKSVQYTERFTAKSLRQNSRGGVVSFSIPGQAERFQFKVERMKYKNDDEFVWYGKNPDNPYQYALFMAKGGQTFGLVKDKKGESFEFYTFDNETQVVLQSKSEALNCPVKADTARKVDRNAKARQVQCAEPTRVLIMYNARVMYDGNWNYQQLAYLGAELHNQAVVNSGMAGTPSNFIEIVGFAYNNFNESQSATWQYSDWARLSSMSNVQNLRNAYKADIVVQFVQGGDWLGSYWNDSAYQNPGYNWSNGPSVAGLTTGEPTDPNWASVIVVARTAASGVLAHEIGHVFGGDHQPGSASSPIPYAKAYGFLAGNNWYQEIMYSNGGNYLHYGNPNVSYNGVPTGIANQYDNARRMTEISPRIQGFQPSATGYAAIDGEEWPSSTIPVYYEAVYTSCNPVYNFEWQVSYDGWNYSTVSWNEYYWLQIPGNGQTIYLRVIVSYSNGTQGIGYITIHAPNCGTCRQATEFAEDSELSIYPNPAVETATVKFSLSQKAEVSRLIANMQGQIVQKASYGTLEAGTHEQTVDVRNLPTGTYLVNVRAGKKSFRQKLVITH